MANRVVREGILTSDSVNKLSWAAEVFYRRLMSVVDDFGRYDGRASILRGMLFPLRLDKVSESDVSKWMGECSEAGVIRFYHVDNKPYLELLEFRQTIRIKKPKYPPPDEHLQADASRCKQMNSTCVSGDGVESGVESGDGEGRPSSSPTNFSGYKENGAFTGTSPMNYGDLTAAEMLLTTDVAISQERYFGTGYFERTREQLCMAHHLDQSMLEEWGGVFVTQLIRTGKSQKTLQDFAQHFANWLPKQDLNVSPKKALEYERQKPNNAGASAAGLNAAYKAKLAQRMAGNSG